MVELEQGEVSMVGQAYDRSNAIGKAYQDRTLPPNPYPDNVNSTVTVVATEDGGFVVACNAYGVKNGKMINEIKYWVAADKYRISDAVKSATEYAAQLKN